MRKIGIYIHIPFCKHKCLYCDFVSFENREEMQEQYMQSLKKEIENWLLHNQDIKIETIYIGGGTPSCIESKNIIEILKQFPEEPSPVRNIFRSEPFPVRNIFRSEPSPVKKDLSPIEKTIEVNPGTVTERKMRDYKEAGINRISIGLQSTDDVLLKQIGRIHTYQDFLRTYMLARKVGFKNINVDLMIGLPNQSIQNIKQSLHQLMELEPYGPEHISVYSLIVEENTALKMMIDSKKLQLPDEELERNMYWYVKDFLEINGYKHYEISNFAKPGYESKHNVDCWKQKEYRGFGISACSYVDGKRFCNTSNLEDYIKNIEENNYQKNLIIQENQSKKDMMKEYILLGLRKLDGVSIQQFENKFNENPIIIFRNEFNKLNEEELLMIDGDKIKLSNKGLDFANLVWEEFV